MDAGALHQCSPAPAAKAGDPPHPSVESLIPTLTPESQGGRLSPPPVKSAVNSGNKPAPRKPADSAVPSAAKKALDEPPTGIGEMLKDPAKVVNQYVLALMLGKGGMGQVWKAWDNKLSRWVALKFLTLTDETNIKRFEREAKLAARLRHPNIAAIYEVGEDKGRHFIAMEFVDGVSLGKAALTIPRALEAIAKIARALAEAHKDGIIHRDLKPDNLMITKAGRPYVMDFGLAKAVEAESSLSVSGDIMGTPLFMSPEQARGEVDQLDLRTDVYSLGATLYTLLTGEKPFTGKTSMEILVKVVGQDPTPPRKIKPEIPVPIEAVVLKAMEKDRDRRYPTAIALAEDLERFLANEDVEARLPSISTLILRRLKRNIWPAALGSVVLVALAAGIVMWAARPPAPQNLEWLNAFRNERRALEFRTWKVGDPGLPSRIHDLLARVAAHSALDSRESADWFRKEIDLAENGIELWQSRPRADWMKLHDSAVHAMGWCDAASGALAGLKGEFDGFLSRLAPLKSGAETIAAWRGEFTLRVAVVPFGEVKSLKRAGQQVPLKDRETPLVIPDLEIDDYEIELGSGSKPSFTLAIPAKRLRDGVTTTIVGDLRKAGTVQITP
jgi:serine/threonine protein kinase